LNIETGSPEANFRLEGLSEEWAKGGGRVTPTVAASCIVTHCRGMAFVALMTTKGPKPVCLKHYERLDKVLVA
jgi:hypothetical protein